MLPQTDELANYIKSVLTGIKHGIPRGFQITSPVRFDLAIINKRESGGSIKILVATYGEAKTKE